MKHIMPLLIALAVATTAQAFSFSATAPSGQTLYFTITTGTNVKVVAPATVSWSGYTAPTGSLVIPSSVSNGGVTYTVKAIDRMAFEQCNGLTSVTIPGSVETIGMRAFANDTLLESVVMQEGVKSIDMMAFNSCKRLVNIQLPTSLTRIAIQAFTNTGYYNDSYNWIDGKALLLGQWVLQVGNLVEGTYIMPAGIRGIANNAFLYCRYIDFVELPSSLQIIGEGAFKECYALDSIRIHATTPPSLFSDSFEDVPFPVALGVPCSTEVAYTTAEYWNAFDVVEVCDGTDPVAVPEVEDVHEIFATPAQGGIMIHHAEGMRLTLHDMLGRRIQTVENADAVQFVPLMSSGLYVVTTSDGQAIKISYCK